MSAVSFSSTLYVDHKKLLEHPKPDSIKIHAEGSDVAGRRIARPTTAHELLLNIKVALQQGLLLSSTFYTDDNLRRFFGTTRIVRQLTAKTNRSARLFGLSYLPVKDVSRLSVGVSWSLIDSDNQISTDGKIHASIGISADCKLGNEDIEAVFGTAGRTIATQTVPADAPGYSFAALPPTTAVMGNQNVIYEIPNGSAHRSTLSVLFDSYGKIKAIDAKQWEE